MRRQLHVQFIFKHPTKLDASSKLSIKVGKICYHRGRTIARVDSLGAENLEAQEHYSLYNNSTFLCITMFPSVSKYLLNGIPSHVLTVIRMMTFFLAGISKINITTAYLAFVFFFTRFRLRLFCKGFPALYSSVDKLSF